MSEPTAGTGLRGVHADATQQWWIRDADAEDLPKIAHVLAELLTELGGTAPSEPELSRAAAEVIAHPENGCLLVAHMAHDRLVGVLAGSFQHAIHVPGRYCILQDLWTDPSWRSQGIGAGLVAELLERTRARGIDRVEVGLPSERFEALSGTEAFYLKNGFTLLGPRMRRGPR